MKYEHKVERVTCGKRGPGSSALDARDQAELVNKTCAAGVGDVVFLYFRWEVTCG